MQHLSILRLGLSRLPSEGAKLSISADQFVLKLKKAPTTPPIKRFDLKSDAFIPSKPDTESSKTDPNAATRSSQTVKLASKAIAKKKLLSQAHLKSSAPFYASASQTAKTSSAAVAATVTRTQLQTSPAQSKNLQIQKSSSSRLSSKEFNPLQFY